MRDIQSMMKELFGNSCLAYSYAYIALETDDPKKLTAAVLKGWTEGYIDDDGYVRYPVKYLNSLSLGIGAVDIQKHYDNYPKEPHVEEWQLNGMSHFVVAEGNKIVFDPAGNSNTVKKGKRVSWRKIL